MIDANDSSLMAPLSMKKAFDDLLGHELDSKYDYFRCAYLSLADTYRRAIEALETSLNRKYTKIYIVGGGAKNKLLNRLTQSTTGKEVIAVPIEATALGNLKVQMNR